MMALACPLSFSLFRLEFPSLLPALASRDQTIRQEIPSVIHSQTLLSQLASSFLLLLRSRLHNIFIKAESSARERHCDRLRVLS